MCKEMLNIGLGVGGLVIGLVGIGYGLASRKKLDNLCDKLDTTINDMSKTIDVDIPKAIIEEATNRAVENAVDRAVRSATRSIEKTICNEIESEVRESVRVERDHISEHVTKQITEEVAKINSKSLTKVVREDARDMIVKKFDGELDDLLEKCNDHLDSVTKVYSSIAKRFTGNSYGSGQDLKISLG